MLILLLDRTIVVVHEHIVHVRQWAAKMFHTFKYWTMNIFTTTEHFNPPPTTTIIVDNSLIVFFRPQICLWSEGFLLLEGNFGSYSSDSECKLLFLDQNITLSAPLILNIKVHVPLIYKTKALFILFLNQTLILSCVGNNKMSCIFWISLNFFLGGGGNKSLTLF